MDRIAICLTAVCVVHCAAMPIALTLIPALAGSLVGEERFHSFMLWLVLPSSAVAVTLGCRKHKDVAVVVMGLLGLGLLVYAAFYGHETFGEWGERALTVAGGGILSVGHLRNYLLCRKESCTH
ncbi:MAG: MerC domain-containing protein [Candidatus Hydrogenedentes bacterium]|nr:MerC domain-containing protein [Candidatus Hydrogenedentota bacterium]